MGFLVLCTCSGTRIPVNEYSLLTTPQETYEFAKKAVQKDDPEAFYYCLSESTHGRFSLAELKLGWNFAGSFFYLFLDSQLKKSEIPAPEPVFCSDKNTAKVTLASYDLQASFLLYREDNKWRLVFPAPYPLPDISKIKTGQQTPWRMENHVFYQNSSEDWLSSEKSRKPEFTSSTWQAPQWRWEDAYVFYQDASEDWLPAKPTGRDEEDDEPSPRTPSWRAEE